LNNTLCKKHSTEYGDKYNRTEHWTIKEIKQRPHQQLTIIMSEKCVLKKTHNVFFNAVSLIQNYQTPLQGQLTYARP
jgi:hypothetical protein